MIGDYVKCKAKMVYKLFPKGTLESGEFGIVKFLIDDVLEGDLRGGVETFVGIMCELEYGEVYTIFAEEMFDDKFGKQYSIKFIGQPASLSTEKEQRIFLSKILTENQVNNLYSTFDNPIEIILDGDIEKLCQVQGLGAINAQKLIDKVESSIDYSSAYVELDDYGLSNHMIQKLIEVYKSPEVVIKKIKENPYILSSEIEGIGFKKCDSIALSNGYTLNDPRRLKALSLYILDEYAQEGYSYIHAYDFMDRIEEETDDLDNEILGDLIKNNNEFYAFTKDEERYIALSRVYNLERRVAEELIRINNGENKFKYDQWQERIKQIEQEQGWEHTDEQLKAIEELLNNQILVISGFGGTGKSSSVGGMIAVLPNYSFAQTALSGRASSRMQEITGEDGFTIHRLLGYNPRTGFTYTRDNQLEIDIVILDELSMVGGDIFLRLLEAIPTGTKLALLGDEGQLESIGLMNILTDLIKSNVIKSCQLTKIHRQAQKSGIIEASMKIRNKEQLFGKDFTGEMIIGELQDCKLSVTKDSEKIPRMIENEFKAWLEKTDIMELQVVVPMKDRGNGSCFPLNLRLQEIYNPIKKGLKTKSLTFTKDKKEFEIRVGDKVINRKNNYKTVNTNGQVTYIFNGNIGIVKNIDEDTRTMIIDFYGIGEIVISKKALQGIELGYVITTHSSQGSQFDVVIYSLDHSAYRLLNKEQAYTGITRAKKYCSIVAENKSLRYATETSEIKNKQTFLADLLDEINI